MEVRSMFKRLFGREREESERQFQTLRLLNDNAAVFTSYNGDFANDTDVLSCIDAIARNGAKMHPRHIRDNKDGMKNLKGRTYRILAKQPNEFQNAYQFYYQLIATLETYNDAFAWVKKDNDLRIQAIYPLMYDEGKYYEYNDNTNTYNKTEIP